MDFEIRKVRTAQGPRKLHAERAEYFRLVKAGYSNKEASALVGVNERTGREWRNGRGDPERLRPPAAQAMTRPDQARVYTALPGHPRRQRPAAHLPDGGALLRVIVGELDGHRWPVPSALCAGGGSHRESAVNAVANSPSRPKARAMPT